MKNVILKRTYFDDAAIGHLYIEGESNPVFSSIERPNLDNESFKSCIPEGEYIVNPYTSDKYKNVWEVTNVKDRSSILIHAANMASEVQGCIAIGLAGGYMIQDGINRKAVTNSRQAIRQLKVATNYPAEFNLIVTS